MKILDFPLQHQVHNYDCGAAALQNVLAYYGTEMREDVIIKAAKTSQKNGTKIPDILSVAKKFGLKVNARKMTIKDLKNFINKKIPVIVALQAWTKKKKPDWQNNWSDGHYSVVIGYDNKKIYFADPSCFNRVYLSYGEFEKRWHDMDSKGKKYINYGMAMFGKTSKFKTDKIVHMD